MGDIRKIEGDRIFLAPFNPADSSLYARWLNQVQTGIYLSTLPLIITSETVENYHASVGAQGDHIFGIWVKKEDRLVGSCGLQQIDFVNRRAQIGIYIGEPEQQNRGLGTETVLLLLDYGFNILNLNSIYLLPYSFNTRAVKCYEKCGFKMNGVYRQARIINGKPFDQLYMDMVAEEFPGYRLKEKLDALLAGEGETNDYVG